MIPTSHSLANLTTNMKPLLAFLALLTVSAVAQSSGSPSVEQLKTEALAAIGGADKVLKLFRIEEQFHAGNQPEPPAGKQKTQRRSVIEPPTYWWVGSKERAEEPAKFDVWGWTLGVLIDPKSKIESIPGITDEGKTTRGLRVSGTVDPAMDLHFDITTHRLLRIDWRADFYRFSDWKEHDGAHYPSKCVIYKTKTGKPWFFHEIITLERLKELPSNLKR
jgi:hypothetical protein